MLAWPVLLLLALIFLGPLAALFLQFLRNRLARYEVPTQIAIVDAIPRTPSGKPDLSAIRAG